MAGYVAAGTQGKAGVRTSREGGSLLNPKAGMVGAGEQEAKLDAVGVEVGWDCSSLLFREEKRDHATT